MKPVRVNLTMPEVYALLCPKCKAALEKVVQEKLEEFLGDPDAGLELREEVKEQLRQSLEASKRGEKGKPMEQVYKELGSD